MIVYVVAFATCLFFSKCYINFEKKYRYNPNSFLNFCHFIITFAPLWFISAFRYDVGTDYFGTYVKYYDHTKLGMKPYKDFLFQYLNDLLVKLNLSYVWLFAITSFIFLYFIFRCIFSYSKRPLFSIIILFASSVFFNSLNNVRQYMALALALYSYLNNNKIKKIVLLFFSIGIHFSSILFIPIMFIKRFKFSFKALLIFGFLLITIMTPITIIFLKNIVANTRYAYFIGSIGTGYSLLFVLMNFSILLMMLLYFQDDNQLSSYIFLQSIVCYLCLCSCFIQNEEMWMRIIRIFTIFQIISIPNISFNIKKVSYRQIYDLINFFVCIVYTIYTVIIMGGQEILPYHFVF